jgi:gliding motility-associated lipoprotein GldH
MLQYGYFSTFALLLKKYLFILAITAFLFAGCNGDVLVDEYHTLPVSGWEYKDVITDSFEVLEPGHYHQLSANLRINGDYTYANFHVKMNITFPDSSSKEYNVPLQLAEKSGKWLGSGLGDVITFRIPVFHRKFLTQKGKYTVSISQDMRLESVPNIVSAGLRVEQQEEIF